MAKLRLNSRELEKLTDDLQSIISFVDYIQSIDTAKIPHREQSSDFTETWRRDKIRPMLSQKEGMRKAPGKNEDFFIVPRAIG